MPPMPPPPGIAGALSFLGVSVIMASVVTSKPAAAGAESQEHLIERLLELGEGGALTLSV